MTRLGKFRVLAVCPLLGIMYAILVPRPKKQQIMAGVSAGNNSIWVRVCLWSLSWERKIYNVQH